MGSVFMAQQTEPLKRAVAVKVPALVLEHVQLARKRIAEQDRPHHAGQRVDPLATVHGLDRHENATRESQADTTTPSPPPTIA